MRHRLAVIETPCPRHSFPGYQPRPASSCDGRQFHNSLLASRAPAANASSFAHMIDG
jgi:hypothetical protein